MKRVLSFAVLAAISGGLFMSVPAHRAGADSVCYTMGMPTPIPAGQPKITLPACSVTGPGNALNVTVVGSGGTPIPTPVPLPTGAGGVLQVTGSGTAGVSAPGVLSVQGIPFGYGLIVQIGGSTYTSLTSASATACTSIEANVNGMLAEIINTGAAQTVFLTVYDEGASPTCSAADIIYGDGSTVVLGTGQITTFGIPLKAGLAYKLSGALGANVLITRNG